MVSESQKDNSERMSLEAQNPTVGDEVLEVNETRITAVIFTLDDNYYAINGNDISEILQFTKINFVPGCPDFILGMVNIRGNIESVVSLHALLDIDKPDFSKKSRIIIADRGGVRSGILVDFVDDVIDIEKNLFNTSLYTHDKKFVVGETFYQDKYVAIIDVEKLFSQITA